ncbi:MAG: hypothetical protein ACJ72Z_13575 [Pyrinomonadaceae bacterium]
MKNDPPVNDLTRIGANRYPHIKITNESFPRALATRRVENDGDEYFGAFLPKTACRILIDFVNRTFRLRSCDIPIDGNFPVPCTQYFRRRCIAPCVKSICPRDEYLRTVELVRLFLSDDRDNLASNVKSIVDAFSKREDFEAAARYRDMMIAVDKFWNEPRKNAWLNNVVDTFAVEETETEFTIFLVTHRGRKVLGRKVFIAKRVDYPTAETALSFLIDTFYQFHLPKEIRVPTRMGDRAMLEERLSQRFGRVTKISLSYPSKKGVNAFRGLNLSHAEHLLDISKPTATAQTISAELMNLFGLNFMPTLVEAFDVAHISGTGFAAASAVWDNGEFLSADYRFLISDEISELAALADAVKRSFDSTAKTKRLILIDGGRNQLNKVLKAVRDLNRSPIIAAVKPKGKHSSIAAFLTESGDSIQFDVDSPTHAMLQLLRDEAHDLANRVHRDYREMLPFYETRGFEEPLIVPLRFQAENSGAEDLIPINSK